MSAGDLLVAGYAAGGIAFLAWSVLSGEARAFVDEGVEELGAFIPTSAIVAVSAVAIVASVIVWPLTLLVDVVLVARSRD